MSLIIYDRLIDIPKDVKYIQNVGLYFDRGGVVLTDEEEVKELLQSIDNAIYVDARSIRYPWKPIVYRSEHLSMGLKVLLSIRYKTDICFDANNCGDTVLSKLLHLRSGQAYLDFPYIGYKDIYIEDCDIIWRGEHFTNVYDFIGRVSEVIKNGGLGHE